MTTANTAASPATRRVFDGVAAHRCWFCQRSFWTKQQRAHHEIICGPRTARGVMDSIRNEGAIAYDINGDAYHLTGHQTARRPSLEEQEENANG